MKTYQSACSLDCWDACSIIVSKDSDDQIHIAGDPDDPITKGFLCSKVKKMVEHFQQPDRLTSPIKRTDDGWESISWDQALDEIAAHISELMCHHGPHSLIHYTEGGHGGLSKNIDTAFFNALGGVTTPTGSLCWGAGIAAQKMDFGNAYCHPPHDLAHTNCLILWGRNPCATNIHLVPFIQRIRKQGVPVFLVDPAPTASNSLADEHLALRPGSDGHLALAISKFLLEQNQIDVDFIRHHSKNGDLFLDRLKAFSYEELIGPTGLSRSQVFQMGEAYGKPGPASIYLGYGMQRNGYGGRNVRLIDAMAAIAGNIGVPGGGVNYAHRHITRWVDQHYLENTLERPGPSFPRTHFATYINALPDQAVQAIFVSKANPVIQLPDTNNTLKAFQKIPLKVVIDHFMTDTAMQADYVLPPTMILEEADVLFSSMWHNRLTWTERAADSPPDVRHEFQIFHGLAKRLKMNEFLSRYPDQDTYLAQSLLPLCRYLGTTPDSMRGKRFGVPGNELPWKDRQFETPDGHFQFYLPDPHKPLPLTDSKNDRFPLRLLTVHRIESLHSQHLGRLDADLIPDVVMHPETAGAWDVTADDRIKLVSESGFLHCRVRFDSRQLPGLLVMKQGTWLKNGPVNQLTSPSISDIGLQAAYADCFVRIERN